MKKEQIIIKVEQNLEVLYEERKQLIKGNNDLTLNAGSIVALNRLLLDIQKMDS
jgi:hypothetical protein